MSNVRTTTTTMSIGRRARLIGLVSGLLACIATLPVVAVSQAPGPRDPLNAHDSGLYCGWNDYFLDEDCPFDFFVVPGVAYEDRDHTDWADKLRKARGHGKRIILVLIPQAKDENGQWYGLTELDSESPPEKLDRLVDVVDQFFSQVDVNQLYAVTLGEEHIFWDGRAELLNRFYGELKARHDVPVYQWFSPSTGGSIPGISGWPNLKADGWVSDEYHLDQPQMEKGMRGFKVLGKPVIHIVWAGGENTSVPFIPERFEAQTEVCRKYDIPTAYFTWYGKGGAWGWSPEAPKTLQDKFDRVLQRVEAAKDAESADPSAWDTVPWSPPVIELGFTGPDDETPSYHEDFTEDRVVRFVNDAAIEGFEHLRWDSSPVELRPRTSGPAAASITYAFASPFPIKTLNVRADFSRSDAGAEVSVTIVNAQGRPIASREISRAREGVVRMGAGGAQLPGDRFSVVIAMSGRAETAGEVLAAVSLLDVEAAVQLPKEKAIEPALDQAGRFTYAQGLDSWKFCHTAELRNVEKLRYSASGLHADANPGTLELVQAFRLPHAVHVTAIELDGSADEDGAYNARVGVGISTDGVNVLRRVMSRGAFNGVLAIDPDSLAAIPPTDAFYVHLFLDGGFGLIRSFTVKGDTSDTP